MCRLVDDALDEEGPVGVHLHGHFGAHLDLIGRMIWLPFYVQIWNSMATFFLLNKILSKKRQVFNLI